MPQNHACQRCPLYQTSKTVCAWGDGNPQADIMLIGEALGAEEERTGKPFQGPAGQFLNELLASVGLNREEVYITNIVKCRPPGNRTPTKQEQAACFSYLAEEIATVQPKVIMALGGSPLSFLTGKQAISKERGKILEPQKGIRLDNSKLLATFHPAAYLYSHDPNTRQAIMDDLAMVKRMVAPSTEMNNEALLWGSYSLNDMVEALRPFKDTKVMAADLEWSGTEDRMMWPWTKGSEAFSIAFAGRVNGEIHTVGLAWPLPDGGDRVLQAVFDRFPLVFHNAMADLIWTQGLGYRVRLAGDSMLLQHLLDEEAPLSLDQVAVKWANAPAGWKQSPEFRRPVTDDEWQRMLTYNCGDSRQTLLSIEGMHTELNRRPEQERANILRLYQELVLPSVVTFVGMALEGMPLDLDMLRQTIAESKIKQREHAVRLGQMLGLPPEHAQVIATSPQQTTRMLRDQFGLEIDGSSKAALEEHDDHPVVLEVQGVRHEQKFQGTYLEPWLHMAMEQGDETLHSVYRMITRTGRTSAQAEEGGSIQLAPREERVRRNFKARDRDGKKRKLIIADYSQAELRIAAWFAGERTMLKLYNEGRAADLHITTAGFISAYTRLRLSAMEYMERREEFAAEVTRPMRQQGKIGNFGLIFGMQPPKLIHFARQSYKTILTMEDAVNIHSSYFTLYADLIPWHERSAYEAARLGYVTTVFGRYRRNIEDGRKAVNSPVQGTATELTMLVMNEIRRALDGKSWARLCGFVHDSIESESDEEAAEETAYIIQHVMENPPWEKFGIRDVPVPFYADVHISDRWIE